MRCVILAVALTLGVSGAPGATLSVDKSGFADFSVIQDALDVAAEGDSILIGSGRYDDFSLFDWAPVSRLSQAVLAIRTSDLTIIGADSASVLIGPETPMEYVAGHETIGVAVAVDLTGLHIVNLTIENLRLGGITSGATDFTSCVFRQNLVSSLYVNAGSGMVYSRCSFRDQPVSLQEFAFPMSNLVLRDCTFGPSGPLSIEGGVEDVLIESCLVIGNGTGVSVADQSTATVENCRFEDNGIHLQSFARGRVRALDSWFSPGADFAMRLFQLGNLEIHGNRIGGATIATISASHLASADQLVVTGNDLLNGGGLSVKVPIVTLEEPTELAFGDNFWGTTDTNLIDDWIEDDQDASPESQGLGFTVIYEPIRTTTVPIAKTSIGSLKALFERLKQ